MLKLSLKHTQSGSLWLRWHWCHSGQMRSDRLLDVFPRCPSLIDFSWMDIQLSCLRSQSGNARILTLIDVEQHLARQCAQCCCIQGRTLLTWQRNHVLRSVVSSSKKHPSRSLLRSLHELLLAFIYNDLWRDYHIYFEMMGSDAPPQYSGFESRRPRGCSLMFVRVSQVINPTWLTWQALGGLMGLMSYRSP